MPLNLPVRLQITQQLGEGPEGQQFHIFGEHGEETAHEESCHMFRRVLAFQRAGEFGEAVGDLARDFRADAAGVQRERIGPDGAQQVARFAVQQALQRQAEAGGIGEGQVLAAHACPVRVEADGVAYVHYEQKGGRPSATFFSQCARIALGLRVGLQHMVSKPLVPRTPVAGLQRFALARPSALKGRFIRPTRSLPAWSPARSSHAVEVDVVLGLVYARDVFSKQ